MTSPGRKCDVARQNTSGEFAMQIMYDQARYSVPLQYAIKEVSIQYVISLQAGDSISIFQSYGNQPTSSDFL